MTHIITNKKMNMTMTWRSFITRPAAISQPHKAIVALLAAFALAIATMQSGSAAPIANGSVMHDGGGAPETPTTDEQSPAPVYRGNLEDAQWHLPVIGVDNTATGAGITVALIGDTVWAGAPDLDGRVLPGYDIITGKPIPVTTTRDFDTKDGFHGTFAAGLIAGAADRAGIRGVAPQANILPVVVSDREGATDRSVADGITWAANNGADVILLFGNEIMLGVQGDETATCAAITSARSLGVTTVTSASSASRFSTTSYVPARCEDVLNVAGVSSTFGELAGETNDVIPDLAAPATQIASIYPDMSHFPYQVNSSSDWAAAQVAGAAASLLGKQRQTPAELITKLTTTAVDLNTPGVDAATGAGLLDVAAATGNRTGRTATELATLAAASSVANVTDLTRDGTGKTSISWEPPTNAPVTTYQVVITAWDGKRWTDARFPVAGDVIRTVLERDVSGESFVAVNAIVKGVERPGFPDAWISTKEYVPAPPVDAKITKIIGVWVDGGLNVTVERNEIAANVRWSVAVLDPYTKEPVKIKRDINIDSYTLFFNSDDSWRETPMILMGWIGGNDISELVWPQYALDAEGYAAGKNHAAVSGSATFACLEENVRAACEGTVLTIVDTKTKKVLATTVVLEDLTFSAVFPWTTFNMRVQVLGPDGVTSKPITKGLTWRK